LDHDLYLSEDRDVVDQGLRGNQNTPTWTTSKLPEDDISCDDIKDGKSLLSPLEIIIQCLVKHWGTYL